MSLRVPENKMLLLLNEVNFLASSFHFIFIAAHVAQREEQTD